MIAILCYRHSKEIRGAPGPGGRGGHNNGLLLVKMPKTSNCQMKKNENIILEREMMRANTLQTAYQRPNLVSKTELGKSNRNWKL